MSKCSKIVGFGLLCSIANGATELASALRRGDNGVGCFRRVGGNGREVPVAELQNFSFSEQLERFAQLPDALLERARVAARRAPRTVQTGVIAALEAWEHAGLHRRTLDPDTIGLVVAGSNINQQYQHERFSDFARTPEHLSPRYALHFLDTDLVGTLSEVFGICGEGFTAGGASASGNVGLILADRMLKSGRASLCLVLGALADLSPVEVQGFANVGALGGKTRRSDPRQSCRPFDRGADGFAIGEASACLVLETAESAERRSVRAYGEIAGSAMALAGTRTAEPSAAVETKVMQAALRDAGAAREDVGYVNAHGTASPIGDAAEVAAISSVFAEQPHKPWVNATKGLLGHCLSSAGVVEAIASLIQLDRGFVHPNLNLDDPIDTAVRFAGAHSQPADVRLAISNSFGFGGINTSVVLRRSARVAPALFHSSD